MAFLHEKDDHNQTDEKKEYSAEKTHLIGEFVKFGGHALHL